MQEGKQGLRCCLFHHGLATDDGSGAHLLLDGPVLSEGQWRMGKDGRCLLKDECTMRLGEYLAATWAPIFALNSNDVNLDGFANHVNLV
jgi:hypothetical protein